MNGKVIVESWNRNQLEWSEDFEASTMAAAKAKATRWMNSQEFEIAEKEEVTKNYQIWEIQG